MSKSTERAIARVNEIEAQLGQSPIGKALVDSALSLVPVLGPAVSSALSTRASTLAQRNTALLLEELRLQLQGLGAAKLDETFLESEEFVTLLVRTLEFNARTHRQQKVRLFARVFFGFLHGTGSQAEYKHGFVRLVDELEPEHIAALAIVHRDSNPVEDGKARCATAAAIAEELHISEPRALAYGEQMIRYGLVRDFGIGKYDYSPGSFVITDYGREFCEHLGPSTPSEAVGDG